MSAEVVLGKLKLKNPVLLASGTFDKTIIHKIDINRLGGIVTKTVTLKPKVGNPLPHIIKTKYGFINSVGLKNPGIDKYLQEELPFWQKFDTVVIPSIGGEEEKEYIALAKTFNNQPIKAIEVNISCPNVKKGGMAFGKNSKIIFRLIKNIRKNFQKTLIVKLTPNVTDIEEVAKNASMAGADILTIANTYIALDIDSQQKKIKLAKIYGGYSGPAIKPITLALVRKVYQKLKCPIIGSGGIENFQDTLDYILVGASAVTIGSANYLNPMVSIKIIQEFEKYLKTYKIKDISKIRGII